ncbi:MAG: hypothetical protein F4X83_05210 [Chloroflexi bacterium]|nr:hypothetical protein [Chloroflexota bacterium]
MFALTRPTDARASALDGEALRLTLLIGSREIAVGEIAGVELTKDVWRWAGVLIRTPSVNSAVSGLSKRAATALVTALENARARVFSSYGGALVATAARLQSVARPEDFVRRRAFEEIREAAARAAAPLAGGWPEGMARTERSPEMGALERVPRSRRIATADRRAARGRRGRGRLAGHLPFARADIAIMRNFGAGFWAGIRSELKTTFRCSDGVGAVATRFVLDNPARIPRVVETRRKVEGPSVYILQHIVQLSHMDETN